MELTFKVTAQGDPIVNSVTRTISHEDITCLEIDLATKRCEIAMSYVDDMTLAVMFQTTESTPEIGETENRTDISITLDRKGWNIYMDECIKYTARIVLVRQDTTDHT